MTMLQSFYEHETQLDGAGSGALLDSDNDDALRTLLPNSSSYLPLLPLASNESAAATAGGSSKQKLGSSPKIKTASGSRINMSPGPKRWSPEEEEALVQAHISEGNRWGSIAQLLPGGRTHLEVKVSQVLQ